MVTLLTYQVLFAGDFFPKIIVILVKFAMKFSLIQIIGDFLTDHRKDDRIGNIGAGEGATTKAKRTLKKVNLAVVKQRKKDNGNLELMKTLDEYVSTNHNQA